MRRSATASRRPPAGRAQSQAAVRPIPFTAAAHEHSEPTTTQTILPGAAGANFGPFDVPAYGFLRNLFFEVTWTGGALGTGVVSGDFPWNLFQTLSLIDVNGAPIFGPLDGFSWLLSNVYGGYAFRQDPRLMPLFNSAFAAGGFTLRVPVEISRHNAFGALANQNAAAAYKLSWITNPLSVLLSTVGTATAPTFTIKVWLEAWSQPNRTDLAGRPQMTEPPGHGTTQFWSQFQRGVVAGNQTFLLPRVGNLIRNLVFVSRNASGVRDDTVFPATPQITWDARILNLESQNYRIQRQMEQLAGSPTRDVGVFNYAFDNLVNGHEGDEEPNLWIPTVQSTRLELDGSNSTAGTIQVLTNDIAPVEVRPDERYVETSVSGFHPNVGQPVPAAQ